jgi:hypothetical protein
MMGDSPFVLEKEKEVAYANAQLAKIKRAKRKAYAEFVERQERSKKSMLMVPEERDWSKSEKYRELEELRKKFAKQKADAKAERKEARGREFRERQERQEGRGGVQPLRRIKRGKRVTERLKLAGEGPIGIVKEEAPRYEREEREGVLPSTPTKADIALQERRKREAAKVKAENEERFRLASSEERRAMRKLKKGAYKDQRFTGEPRYATRVARDPLTGEFKSMKVNITGYPVGRRAKKRRAKQIELLERQEKATEAQLLRAERAAKRFERAKMRKEEDREIRSVLQSGARKRRRASHKRVPVKNKRVKKERLTYVEREERGEDVGLVEDI